MNWKRVKRELRNWHGKVCDLSPLALDTLQGTVMSMRWKGLAGMDMSLPNALKKNRKKVMRLTFQQLKDLRQDRNFTYAQRPVPRCRVGYGTYGWKYDPEIIHAAIEQGALIDTAEGYGFGRVETRLGEILKYMPWAEVTSKVRRDHMSPQSLENAARRAAKKLGITFHYQLHYPHHEYPEAILQLAEFRKEGLIKSIGIGNCSVAQIEHYQRMLSDYSGDPIRSVQVSFSLLNQQAKYTTIPYCQKRGILVIAYSPLGQSYKALYRPILDRLAKSYGCSTTAIALAWILSFKGVLPIPRTNNLEHLAQNFEANQIILHKEDVTALEKEYELL